LLIVFLLNIILLYPFFSRNKKIDKDITVINSGVVFQIIFTFLFFLFFYQPLIYYLSAPADIDMHIKSFLAILTAITIIPLIILNILFFILPKRGRVLFTRIILLLLISAFIYSVVIKINTGLLDVVTFQNEQALLKMPLIRYLLDCFIITGIWVFAGYLLERKINLIKLYCFIFVAIMLFTIGNKIIKADYKAIMVKKSTNTELPDSAYNSHKFSREGKNVVFVIADMFNGNYFGRLLNEDARYSEIFSDFLYYPDCLAVSFNTATSLPGIFGGQDYIPVKLNNNGKTGIEEIRKTASIFFSSIFSMGYQATVTNPIQIPSAVIHGASVENPGNYVNYWKEKQGYINEGGADKTGILFMLSIFNSAPYHWKYIIYDNSKWIILRKSALIKQLRDKSIYNLAYIDLLPEISSANGIGNKFFYIHNELTHTPYGVDSKGRPIKDEFPDNNIGNLNSPVAAYYSSKKFIDVMGNWLKWMKENYVYDNTMIIILSDHGNSSNDNDIKLPEQLNNFRVKNDISRAQALLLVKGFSGEGDIVKVSSARVSSADIPYMIAAEAGIPFPIEKDLRKISEPRDLFYSTIVNKWNDFEEKDTVKYRSYKVKGSIFDPDSWSIFED